MWYAFTFLSGSPVKTMTRAALQITQNIFTAALDVWLTQFSKASLSESSLTLEEHTTCMDP